jgi:CDP-glycerol glycerophosphotransferase (TagB/SpsB family)
MKVSRLYQCFSFLLYLASFLFPRKKSKWVFGNYITDQFGDNPKYLFLYLNKYHNDIRAIWITRDPRILHELQDMGLEVYLKNSKRGVYHCLTAKAYFYNAFAEDINFFTSGGAMLINMWHGVGLKKIEFNITRGSLAGLYHKKEWKYRFSSPWRFRRPTYLLSSSPFQSIPFASAFRIPLDRCLDLGYPRNDVMMMPEALRQQLISTYENKETIPFINKLKAFSKVLIYMPTWRDSPTFLKDLELDFNKINRIMQAKNELLILKLHINSANIPADGLSNVWIFPWYLDVYSIFPYTHTLITDYSSVLYDYILLPEKEVILFIYDMEEYLADHEFNYPFQPNVAGKLVADKEGFYQVLSSTVPIESDTDVEQIRTRFWGEYKGHAAKDLTMFVKYKLGLADS